MISMDSNDLYILDTLYVYMFDITWHYMQSLIPNWQVFIILFFFYSDLTSCYTPLILLFQEVGNGISLQVLSSCQPNNYLTSSWTAHLSIFIMLVISNLIHTFFCCWILIKTYFPNLLFWDSSLHTIYEYFIVNFPSFYFNMYNHILLSCMFLFLHYFCWHYVGGTLTVRFISLVMPHFAVDIFSD